FTCFFFFQAEDGIRDGHVTGVQTCALPIFGAGSAEIVGAVVDTTAPTISALPAPTTIQCPATPSFTTPTATDACDSSPTLTFARSEERRVGKDGDVGVAAEDFG